MADEIERQLEQLRNDAVEVRNRLSADYEALPLGDPRRVVGRHIKAVVSTTYLGWINLVDDISDPRWWEQHFDVVPPNAQDEVEDYERLTTAAFVIYPLSLFEAGLRRVVRALDSQACSGGAAEFKSVYDWLFARLGRGGWTYSQGEETQFLDLYREVRNTLHNNGHYYSRKGVDLTLTWRGQTFEFKHGQVPAFLSWDLHVELVRGLVHLNDEIMRATEIAGLPPIP